MPSYVRAGSLPHKRHIQFRRPDGGLYAEELFSTKGFESVYSLLYHLRPPTATLDVRAWDRPAVRLMPNEPLRNRHFKTAGIQTGGDAIDSRRALLGNDDIADFDCTSGSSDGVLVSQHRRRRVALHPPRRRRYRDAVRRSRLSRARLRGDPDRHHLSRPARVAQRACSCTSRAAWLRFRGAIATSSVSSKSTRPTTNATFARRCSRRRSTPAASTRFA